MNDKQPAPAPGWLPDPDGEPYLRWWDGKHWTKRVQGEPPRTTTVVKRDPEPEPVIEEPEPDLESAEPEQLSTHWPPLSVVAAVVAGLGIVSAFLIPLGRLPLIVSAVGVAASVVALVLASGEGQRRVVAVWGIGLGLVGVSVSLTVIEFG